MESLSLDFALHPANYGSLVSLCLEVVQYERLTRSNLYLFTRAALHFQRKSQWWDLLQPSPGAMLLIALVSVNVAQSKSLVGDPQLQRFPLRCCHSSGSSHPGHHLPCGRLSQFAHMKSAGSAHAGLPSTATALSSLFLGFC